MRKTEEYNITLSEDVSTKKAKAKRKGGLNVFEVFEAIIAALVVITVIFTFFFRVFNVDGPSMKPTLQHNDKLIVSTVGYKPEKGDIVVISETADMDEPIVKRVIAVGGDVVDINFTTGVVTVNGTEEDYTDELTSQQFDIAFPITVPEGTVFVLGDNRGNSLDSRSTRVGCVDERYIVGKVLFRFFPLGDWKVE
ncbi:MAG: signal peptidase I [Acutalibacteraceae bacterium]|nr:signal peptidase I [Acutalibacteraceae bacterium]